MRIPESMRRAAEALQRIGRGDGTQEDVAELMMAANASGKTGFQGVVGGEEIARAIRDLESRENALRCAGRWDESEATAARRADLGARYRAVCIG